ncbi:hypothetical protein ACO0QE_001348 [Hanseniaspora vineae]
MSALTKKERKLQNSLIVVPWKDEQEYDELKTTLFSDDTELAQLSMRKVKIWMNLQNNCPVQHVMEYTVLLLEAQLFDQGRSISSDMSSSYNTHVNENAIEFIVQQNYCMVLIRFINGLLDPLQNSVYAIPLMKLCEKIGIPKYIVEMRHQATHERIMPCLEMLRFAVSNCLTWVRKNYWDMEAFELQDEEEEEDDDDGAEEADLNDKEKKEAKQKQKDHDQGTSFIQFFVNNTARFRSNQALFLDNVFRSNFEISDENKNERTDRERVMEYIQRLKFFWKSSNAKETFATQVHLLMQKTQIDENDFFLFLRLLFNKLAKFDFYFVTNMERSLLKSLVEKSLLREILKRIDLNKFLSLYGSLWNGEITNVETLQTLITLVETEVPLKKWRKHENYKKMLADLDLLQKKVLEKSDGDKMNTSKQSGTKGESTLSNGDKQQNIYEASSKRSLDSVDDILNDISTLKKKPKSLNAETVKPQVIYRFETPFDWEFKPFGVL